LFGDYKWLNYVLEEKRQRSVNLKFTRLPMPNMYASAVCSGKVTPGGKKNRKKKAGGGVINMTRMQYVKGGRV